MPERIIDIHPHIVSPDQQRYPVTPFGGKQSQWSLARPVTFEELVSSMDAAGVAKAAIVQASTVYATNNGYLADSIVRHRGRFTGVFTVDIMAAGAAREMRHWHARGLRGMRIYISNEAVATGARLDDPRSVSAWECARELDIPVCVSLHSADHEQLRQIARRHPQLKIVIDGLPTADIEQGPPYSRFDRLSELAQCGNIFLKITTNAIRASRRGNATPETLFPKLVDLLGASRLAWGSNFPASTGTLKELLTEARTAFATLSSAERDFMFHRTAANLYPVLAD